MRTGNRGLYCTRKQEVAVSEVMRSSILDRLILRSIEERMLNRELVRKSKEKCDLNVQIWRQVLSPDCSRLQQSRALWLNGLLQKQYEKLTQDRILEKPVFSKEH